MLVIYSSFSSRTTDCLACAGHSHSEGHMLVAHLLLEAGPGQHPDVRDMQEAYWSFSEAH